MDFRLLLFQFVRSAILPVLLKLVESKVGEVKDKVNKKEDLSDDNKQQVNDTLDAVVGGVKDALQNRQTVKETVKGS